MKGDTRSWLEGLGLKRYAAAFTESDIDMGVLPDLTNEDLKELGISLGDRKRLLKAIADLPNNWDPEIDEGELRQLTLLFCDLVGSTQLAVRFDPEDLQKIIVAFQECCERVSLDFGGNVARYMGDGLLVYFGYPTAFEDSPERAVRAGLEIISAVGKLEPQSGVRLQTRVGISTGKVVVGNLIGGSLASERAAVGEPANLAARLQSLAAPDSVVISDATMKLVRGIFDCTDLGLQTAKGFPIPFSVWQVNEELALESRFEATHTSKELTRLVGRDKEIARLWNYWETASTDHGQAVLITGEAGIGKSHLAHALLERLKDLPHYSMRYFCVSYYKNTALFPIIRQLERAADFASGDSRETKLTKLEALLAQSTKSALKTAPLFSSLLSLPASDRYPAQNLSAKRQKEKTLDALEGQISYLAHRKPVVLLFEDLQWADPTTLELLQRLVRKARDSRFLLVMTARTGFDAPWVDYDSLITLDLNRLSDEAQESLISQVSKGKSLPAEVLDQIVDKAAGVPLWITELTKNVLDSGLLAEQGANYVLTGALPSIGVPRTLQDSLMARLDQLATAKEVAQIGASIGRDFPYLLLFEVASISRERLDEALQQLTASELLTCYGEPPDATYTFRHALIQDSAYSSLLRAKRQALHHRIAEALRLHFSEAVKARPELLAHHYTRAGEAQTAIPYWQDAASIAADRAAHTEAIRHLQTALALVAELPEGLGRKKLELKLRATLGLNLETTLGYAAQEVATCYQRAHELCRELGETAELAPVLLGLYVYHLVRSDLAEARELAERSVRISQQAGNMEFLVESYAALGFAVFYQGEIEQSRRPLEECIALSKKRNTEVKRPVTAQDPVVASLSLLAIAEFLVGNADTSLDRLNQARELTEISVRPTDLVRPIDKALVHAHFAELYQLRREPEQALRHAQQGQAISAEHGYDIWSLANTMHMSIAGAMLGDRDQIAVCSDALSFWRASGAEQNVSYFLSGIAMAMQATGDAAEASKKIAEALDQAERVGEYCHVPMLHQLAGTFHLVQPESNFNAAESSFLAAIEKAREQKARQIELRATSSLYRLHKKQGRAAETELQLRKLMASFDEGHDTLDFREAMALLNEKISSVE